MARRARLLPLARLVLCAAVLSPVPAAAGAGDGLRTLPDPTPAEVALDRLVSVDFTDRWMEGALADLGRAAGTPVDVDWAALAATGRRRDDRVTLRLRDKPLRVVLRHLLQHPSRDGATFVAGERRIRVVAGDAPVARHVADYDVRALLPEPVRRPGDGPPTSDGALEAFLIRTFAEEGWAELGTPDGSELRVLPGRVLRLRATRPLHDRLRWLLPAMADPRLPRRAVPFGAASPAARRRALAALAAPALRVRGGRMTVGEALRWVASVTGVDVVVVPGHVPDGDAHPQGVRFELPDALTGAQALAAAAKAAGTETRQVAFLVDNHGIVAFGLAEEVAAEADRNPLVGVYHASAATDQERRDRLVEDLAATVAPDHWRVNGGTVGTAGCWGQALVVVASRQAFDSIDPVARRLAKGGGASTRPATPGTCPSDGPARPPPTVTPAPPVLPPPPPRPCRT